MAKVQTDKRLATKKAIAGRIQHIVEEKTGTMSALRRRDRGLGTTVEAWVPRPTLWKWDNATRSWTAREINGEPQTVGAQRSEWARVHMPGGESLLTFCEKFGVRSGYILQGEGSPYFHRAWDGATLTSELAAYVREELIGTDGSTSLLTVNGEAILDDIVAKAKSEFDREIAPFIRLQDKLRILEISFPYCRAFKIQPLSDGEGQSRTSGKGWRMKPTILDASRQAQAIEKEIAAMGDPSSRYFRVSQDAEKNVRF